MAVKSRREVISLQVVAEIGGTGRAERVSGPLTPVVGHSGPPVVCWDWPVADTLSGTWSSGGPGEVSAAPNQLELRS